MIIDTAYHRARFGKFDENRSITYKFILGLDCPFHKYLPLLVSDFLLALIPV